MSGAFAAYKALVCDLDGVVYRGPAAVPHAVESLGAVDARVLFATNNASRPPGAVAEHLVSLGLQATADDVVNSSQAAAWLLGKEVVAGARVLTVGGEGVAAAVTEAGFRSVVPGEDPTGVVAVVQGFGQDVRARDLGEAAYAVQAGALWVATNTDGTLPTDRGVAPGNGTLVAAVARAVGREPDLVAGKPEPPIYQLCRERLQLPMADLLAVGDRLDTDIAGANTLGMDSLVVLTGVADVDGIVRAPAALRPTWVARDLRALVDGQQLAYAGWLTQTVRSAWERIDGGERVDDVLGDVRAAILLQDEGPQG